MTFAVAMMYRVVRWLCTRFTVVVVAVTSAVPVFANQPAGMRSGQSASSASDVVASAFNGTAYLKTSNTVAYADKPYGPARLAAQGLIDQCNALRKSYDLPPVVPPESVMTALDVTVHEKYFDTNKALTVSTGNILTLPDLQRWSSEARVAPSGRPAVAPDCVPKMMEIRHGTLWRDGSVYQLRYDTHKALARRDHAIPSFGGMAEAFSSARKSSYLGQSCREMVGGVDVPAEGVVCIWDLFPYVSHLNWPFVLSGRTQFGPTAAMFETIVPIDAQHGRPIPSSVFDILSGFAVIGP